MAKVEFFVRRAVAILVAALSFAIFVPVGGFFYVFLLARATISLTLASFISAMTGAALTANVEHLLIQSVSFFPTGLSIIWRVSSSIWRGENFGSLEQSYDAATILTNVLFAIIFFLVLTTLLRAIGWSGFGAPAIFAWLVGTPILVVLMIALVGIFILPFWPVLNDSWRRFWSSTQEKKQTDTQATSPDKWSEIRDRNPG